MEPAIKKLVFVLVIALILVLGLIALTANPHEKDGTITQEQTATSQENTTQPVMAEATQEPTADKQPDEGEQASQADITQQAQANQNADQAQEEVIYEGAVAGLSEEEIAKMALAEEQGTARTEETGIENAVD